MKHKRKHSSKLVSKRTANIIKADRALSVPSKKIAKAMMLTGMFSMMSCGAMIASNPNGYAMNCNGRGCDKFTEYAATLINETKLQDATKSPFASNQRVRDQKPSLLNRVLFGKGAK